MQQLPTIPKQDGDSFTATEFNNMVEWMQDLPYTIKLGTTTLPKTSTAGSRVITIPITITNSQAGNYLTINGTDLGSPSNPISFANQSTYSATSSIAGAIGTSSSNLTKAQIESAINSKANSSHTHDDRYYTESEVNTLLQSKQNTLTRGNGILLNGNTISVNPNITGVTDNFAILPSQYNLNDYNNWTSATKASATNLLLGYNNKNVFIMRGSQYALYTNTGNNEWKYCSFSKYGMLYDQLRVISRSGLSATISYEKDNRADRVLNARLIVKNSALYLISNISMDDELADIRIARKGKWVSCDISEEPEGSEQSHKSFHHIKRGYRCMNGNQTNTSQPYYKLKITVGDANIPSHMFPNGELMHIYPLYVTDKDDITSTKSLKAGDFLKWFIHDEGIGSFAVYNGTRSKCISDSTKATNDSCYKSVHTFHYGLGIKGGTYIIPFDIKVRANLFKLVEEDGSLVYKYRSYHEGQGQHIWNDGDLNDFCELIV